MTVFIVKLIILGNRRSIGGGEGNHPMVDSGISELVTEERLSLDAFIKI